MSRCVIIIGAGPGGSATAMLLPKAGREVTILEKQPRVGGRTSLIDADGYKFDLGPTFFLNPQILQKIFQEVGRALYKEVPMTQLDPQYRFEEFDRMCLVGGGTHPGSGLPVIFESARIRSKLLLEDLN